ncbi:hypothetical protein [Chromobacterium haemolyticum]|uniref:hypothetical protein n=1 Tax=Chromobacterium haemolyticum TaxID=394935 RepID=UPI0013178DD3|nr:hypothetical protein [Chromobacterium haemolyticum]MDH0343091.1 hypothetical protein [Chromobacterium haemolyticum]BBH11992.1 hypothetical protein CH06BL_12400 [Chromobacterium haemolyticum]
MFSKLFGKKPVKTIQQAAAKIKFAGSVQGTGLNALRIEIAKRLLGIGLKNGYLAKLQYAHEEQQRICLVLDAPGKSDSQRPEVAAAFSGVIPMDIVFSDAIPNEILQEITSSCPPILLLETKLFECPIVVGKGTNLDMPAEWTAAIVCFFVAAQDYQEALSVAVEQLRSEGYEFKSVYEGKVHLVDASQWWAGYVMEKWSKYADGFPSQREVEAMVATGAYFKGPVLAWEVEAEM